MIRFGNIVINKDYVIEAAANPGMNAVTITYAHGGTPARNTVVHVESRAAAEELLRLLS